MTLRITGARSAASDNDYRRVWARCFPTTYWVYPHWLCHTTASNTFGWANDTKSSIKRLFRGYECRWLLQLGRAQVCLLWVHSGDLLTCNQVFSQQSVFSAASLWTPSVLFLQLLKDTSSTSAPSSSYRRFNWKLYLKGKKNVKFQVLEFVDDHGNEVLNLGSFTLLPQHVVRLILVREELKADEFSKFQVHHQVWKALNSPHF